MRVRYYLLLEFRSFKISARFDFCTEETMELCHLILIGVSIVTAWFKIRRNSFIIPSLKNKLG